MNNSRGFVPLIVLVVIAAVAGTGAVATYEVSKPEAPANPVKSVVESIRNGISKPVDTPKNVPNSKPKKYEDCPTPDRWSVVVTQSQIDKFLNGKIPYFEYSGYKFEGAKVKLEDEGLSATVKLNDKRAFFVRLKLIEQGRDFNVVELNSVGENKLNAVELAALRVGLLNTDKLVWNYVDGYYKKSFIGVQIQKDSKADIFFYTSEYLDCIEK